MKVEKRRQQFENMKAFREVVVKRYKGGRKEMEKENEPKERDLCCVACLQPVFFPLFCPDVFQMGSYFGYAVAATDVNNDG